MKGVFKNIFITLVMAVCIIGTYSVQASAAADFQVGTANLNRTAENSAVVGSILLRPEVNWKRYDDLNSKIVYEGKWSYLYNVVGEYSGVYSRNTGNIGTKIKFKFYGKKLRLLTWRGPGHSGANVTIDNIDLGNYSSYSKEAQGSTVLFQKGNLSEGVHEVTITTLSKNSFTTNAVASNFAFDAIDTDGILLPYDLDILNKSVIYIDKDNFEKLMVNENTDIIWNSSDEEIAKVDDTGKVTGIKEGKATITAQIRGTAIISSCDVIIGNTNMNTNDGDLSGEHTLYIIMEGGNIEQAEKIDITNFMTWYTNRDLDKSKSPFYKIVNDQGNTEYLIHDKIVSFEIR